MRELSRRERKGLAQGHTASYEQRCWNQDVRELSAQVLFPPRLFGVGNIGNLGGHEKPATGFLSREGRP